MLGECVSSSLPDRSPNRINLPERWLWPAKEEAMMIEQKLPVCGLAQTNMTAVVGSTVVLACRVTSLGTSSVSWLRLPQLTVLSSGGQVFSSSPRVSVIHSEESPDYNLQISSVTGSDSGQYHCQLNTRPARSVLVNLVVRPGQHRLVPALALRAHTANTRTSINLSSPSPPLATFTTVQATIH